MMKIVIEMWIHRVHGSAHSQIATFGRLNPAQIGPAAQIQIYTIYATFFIFETRCANIELTNTALRYTALHSTWENDATSKLVDLPISKHCSGSLPFRLVKVKQKYLG